jgi:uncharacterized membrane protein (UPF0182 family)
MRPPNRWIIIAFVLLVVIYVLGGLVVGFYTDALWFKQIGFASVFWTRFAVMLGSKLGAAVLGAAIVLANLWFVARQLGPVQVRRRYGNLEISEQIPRRIVQIGMFVAAVLAGWWLANVKFGSGLSINVLTWLHRQPWHVVDPLFKRDLSFYVFALPFYYQIVDLLLLVVVWSLILSIMGYALVGTIRLRENKLEVDPRARSHALLLGAALLILVGVRLWIGRYGVLFNGSGFNGGIGYTDVHARLPAQRITALMAILTGGTLVYAAIRHVWGPSVIAGGLLIAAGLGGGALYPSFVQKFRVDPNEFRFEEPYIGWNIDFTRRAYGLDKVNRQAYEYKRTETEPAELSRRLADVPVWDLEPLQTAYNQLQVILTYYHFPDVDYDRYRTPAGTKQVAVSVREFLATELPPNAKTWLNLHFDPKYIRGQGAVVTPAAEMGHGEPPAWLGNVNPIVRSADAPAQLNLTDPSIYFGEQTEDYVVVRKTSGLVAPRTAVPLSNFVRVAAFAWRFGDKNLLFTGGLTDGASLAYRRRISERVGAIAPFISWDPDPYAVIAGGHVVWIMDGYSATDMYPVAQRANIDGVGSTRYLHNTVKATIDAASGDVHFYRFDASDPYIATYANAFPGMFEAASRMPAELSEHVRYPALLLHEQASIYGHYHLGTPETFYRAEDVWQLPQTNDASGANTVQFRAVYQMMTLPGETADEFVLAAPYIARSRQNMTALLIGRNDAPNYGQLVLYELPRNQLVPGPNQVHAIVEQDPNISPQLSLWRQAGSDVNIGHVRVIPIGSGFLYIMPLYLSAQGSPIPELQRIIVSDGTRTAMGNTLSEAVAGLFGTPTPASNDSTPAAPATARSTAVTTATSPLTAKRALDLLDQADRALRSGDFATYGARLEQLRKFLQQASSQR